MDESGDGKRRGGCKIQRGRGGKEGGVPGGGEEERERERETGRREGVESRKD